MKWFGVLLHVRGLRLLLLALLSVSLLPLSRAQAAGGPPSSILDPLSVSWASVRNMTSAQFSDYFDQKSRDGYMVIDIEVDDIDGEQRVGAVWQKNIDGRGWAEWRNMTSDEFHQKWTELRDAGYRPIDQDAYYLNSQLRYAGVWIENKENLAWASYRNQTDAEFSADFKRYSDAGYIIVDVEAYPIGDELRYAAIWVKNVENLGWYEWRNLSSEEFAQKFDEYKGTYRMLDVESYRFDGKQYYAGIWVENKNGRGWAEWRDMTAKSFGDKWLQLRDAGYRLVDYEKYDTANGTRYAGIWRQNSDRPNWRLKKDVDALLEAHADEFDIPGMSVAIAQNGKFVYLRGFGYADIDDEKIAHSRTVYRLASVSKAVAGVLSMRLVEQGEFALNDPSASYIPGLPNQHTHTVGQTLSNRSGIGHYEDYPSIVDEYTTALAATQQLWNTPLVYTPGMGYKYSTHAYTFLGASMEGAVGQQIATIVANQITTPNNLSSLQVENLDQADKNRATLYDSDNDEVAFDDLSWKVLGGGLVSSAYDLARFGVKLLNGNIINGASRTTMWTAPDGQSSYAYGWSTGTEQGTQVVAKDGAQNGARSYIRMYPEKGIVIAVLTNRKNGGHSPVQLGRDIGALMLDAESLLNTADAAESDAGTLIAATATQDPDLIAEPDDEAIDPALVVLPVNRATRQPTAEERSEVESDLPVGDSNGFDVFLPMTLR